MNNIVTLLKMEFLNRFEKISIKGVKPVLKILITLAISAMFFWLILKGSGYFFRMFNKAGLAYEALVIYFTGAFLFLLITNISSTIKVLYFKGDNEILMRFPVSGWEVFWAKTIFLLIIQVALTSLVSIPLLIAYGQQVNVTASFYVSIPAVILFLVFIPFFLSNVLAIPFMHISNKIRHHYSFIILALTIVVTCIFLIYTLIFERIIVYIRDQELFSVFEDKTILIISQAIKYLIPTKYFAGIMLGEFDVTRVINRETMVVTVGSTRTMSYLVLAIILELSVIGSYLVIKKLYRKTLLSNIEAEGSAFKKHTKIKRRSEFSTLIYKEFIQVFRSINYSFQYFVLACSMPIMAYFCNRIALSIGMDNIGNKIIPGLTLMVMLIFNTIIVSFSATSTTREGSKFYHTKVMPVPIHKQLFVKFVMYALVSFLANTITIAIIILTKQMSTDDSFVFMKPLAIYLISIMISSGLTLIAMKMDIIKPKIALSGDGELTDSNSNTTTIVLIGFILSLLFGVAGMLIPYLLGVEFEIMFYALALFALTFLVFSLLFYFIRLKAAYNKIT
ncbi:MAG: hypothetical protein QM214_03785 [Bacillota bacterium]|jgi:hypothetical protein|nr:hypothetical protein [Bacillota bacterium]HHU43871.1 hypothetical protein [Clostridiales bacterium]